MSYVEQPKYKVISCADHIEVRDYEPMLLAEVEIKGERKEAIKNGFKILADYIFGNNISKRKTRMAEPALAEPGEKLAMTAPVMQQKSYGQWKVRFVMPSAYTLDTLPAPASSSVKLISLPAGKFAAIQFSGSPDDDSIQIHEEKLKIYISEHGLEFVGNPIFAFYNSPKTPSFLRRNEVMFELVL